MLYICMHASTLSMSCIYEGVLLDSSQMDEQLVTAAIEFIQHDVEAFKNVKVNVTKARTSDVDGNMLDLSLEGMHPVILLEL